MRVLSGLGLASGPWCLPLGRASCHSLPALQGVLLPPQEVKALAEFRGRAILEPGAGHAPSGKEKHLSAFGLHILPKDPASQPAPFCCHCSGAQRKLRRTKAKYLLFSAFPLHVFQQSCQ